MREIKFRATSIKTGTWVYGVPVESVNGRMYMIHGATEDAVNTRNEVDFIFTEIRRRTIGELTGLKDYDGRDIYEGDVFVDENGPFQVQFNGEVGAWCIPAPDGTAEWLGDYAASYSIIGNIHEHKHLLGD